MRLVAVSCCVPRNSVSAEAVYERFGQEEVQKIVRNSGVRARRIVAPSVTTSDLCFESAQALLDASGWDRSSIDAVVFVTQTPDYGIPATSHILQDRLGLSDRTFCFDVNLGCTGFTHGLLLGEGLLDGLGMNRVLVLVGDTTSRSCSQWDRSVCLLFGDAGGAALLEREGPQQVAGRVWGADGSGALFIQRPASGFRHQATAESFVLKETEGGNRRSDMDTVMDGAQIFNFTIKRVPPMVNDVLAKAEWTADEVDAFVFHQANKFIIDYLRRKLKVPAEKAPTCLEEFGNTSSASIPLTMVTRMREQLEAGPAKLVLVGFGVGLSWSSVAMQTEGVRVLPLIEV